MITKADIGWAQKCSQDVRRKRAIQRTQRKLDRPAVLKALTHVEVLVGQAADKPITTSPWEWHFPFAKKRLEWVQTESIMIGVGACSVSVLSCRCDSGSVSTIDAGSARLGTRCGKLEHVCTDSSTDMTLFPYDIWYGTYLTPEARKALAKQLFAGWSLMDGNGSCHGSCNRWPNDVFLAW